MFTIFTSLASMFGFMGWVYYFTESKDFYFTLMNTSMPIVLLTIANSDGVHVVSRFFKEFVCNLQSICRKNYSDLKIKHRSQFSFCDHENFFGKSKGTF